MKKNNAIAIFGLGRMGAQIARRLNKKKFEVFGWNRSKNVLQSVRRAGIFASSDIGEVMGKMPLRNRIFWIMLPHGVLDDFIFGRGGISKHLKRGDIIIDGGNSFYKDSIRRAKTLAQKGIYFFDCGTSGGVWGEENGFALMVGGEASLWTKVKPIFRALSSGDNYELLGGSGAGHFAKMIHNGIEYGMMEAIAEGYAVLKASSFQFNLSDITRVYQKGSVVRSWLIDLCRNIFEKEKVDETIGKIDATGEGEWTVGAAKEFGVDVRVIEDALNVRKESAEAKNQKKFSNKIVALLRQQFGGHKIYKL